MPTYFRPCIDIHKGFVRQIVGATLDSTEWSEKKVPISINYNDSNYGIITSHECQEKISTTMCNFTSSQPASYFASLFKNDNLRGGHLIMLGQGEDNINSAKDALVAFPKGLHVGGGMRLNNIEEWIEAGAEKVILTSWLFDEELNLSEDRLRLVSELIGRKQFVVDLSCRPIDEHKNDDVSKYNTSSKIPHCWIVCLNGWKTESKCILDDSIFEIVNEFASEMLIHGIRNEGLCNGVDHQLIQYLGQQGNDCCIVYAGGVNSINCFNEIERLSNGTIDVTVGSALDLYGGSLIRYNDCVKWNRSRNR